MASKRKARVEPPSSTPITGTPSNFTAVQRLGAPRTRM